MIHLSIVWSPSAPKHVITCLYLIIKFVSCYEHVWKTSTERPTECGAPRREARDPSSPSTQPFLLSYTLTVLFQPRFSASACSIITTMIIFGPHLHINACLLPWHRRAEPNAANDPSTRVCKEKKKKKKGGHCLKSHSFCRQALLQCLKVGVLLESTREP